MKTEIKIITMVVAFLILSFIIYSVASPKTNNNNDISDSKKFIVEYEALNGELNDEEKAYPTISISKESPIEYIEIEEVIDIIKNKTGIIYLGYPECPWCRTLVNALMKQVENMGIEKVYYYNPEEIRDEIVLDSLGNKIINKEGTEEYKELVSILDDYLWSYNGINDASIKRLYVPAVVFVKDGTIVGVHTSTITSQKDPYIELDNEQKIELYSILEKNINQVYNVLCDESC